MDNKNNKTKSICLRLSAEDVTKISQIAKSKGMTINGYIRSQLDLGNQDKKNTDAKYADVRLKITQKDLAQIKAAAEEDNLTVTEYIRDRAVSNKPKVIIGIEDITALADEVYLMSNKINGIISVICRSGNTYKQDVDKMVDLLTSINNKTNDIYTKILKDRIKRQQKINGGDSNGNLKN